MHQGKLIEEVQFFYRKPWKQMPWANNGIFREMVLLFMKKECCELFYENFSVSNVPGSQVMYYELLD